MRLKVQNKDRLIRLVSISIFASAGAILLSSLLNLIIPSHAFFLISVLGVVFSALYGNTWTGIATLVATLLIDDYLFITPVRSLAITQPTSLTELLISLLVGTLSSIVIEKAKNTSEAREFKRKEKEFVEYLEHLQKQNDVFKKEIKARDEFLSIASHELKTPLTAMLLQLQTALYNIRNVSLANFSVENLLKMLQSTEQQSKRLAKMINDLLNVSLITTGRIDLVTEDVDLSQLVNDVVDRFSEKAKKEGYEIKVKTEENVIGTFDKTRIEQVVTNLLSNAMKYGEKKPIAITVHKHNSTGKITIKDQGIGIPEAQQERVFELFERAVPNHDYKGLGVGLYISSQIVKAHNGKIHVESELHEGSTFTVELPLKKPAN
jgi:signal transduction histidine kinase